VIKNLKELIAAKRNDHFGFHKESVKEVESKIELLKNYDLKTP
jgi:hypothetical protein